MQPPRNKNNRTQNEAVYANKIELFSFLRLLDTNPIIQQFLHYDSSFLLADKYLIAMVFIFFKRAQLNTEDYTYLNFFAGLCLAHSMEEDIDLSSNIYPWVLGRDKIKEQLPKLLKLKMLLWQAMDYRTAVSWYCCKKLISTSKNHPIWQRERSPSYFKQFNFFKASNPFCDTPKNCNESHSEKNSKIKNYKY